MSVLVRAVAMTAVLAIVPALPSQAVAPETAATLVAHDARASTFNVCLDVDVRPALAEALPGELLAPPQDLTSEAGLVAGRLYRVIYGTSGPGDTTQAACTIIAVPHGQDVSHVVIEGHGASGLKQECMPSMNVRKFVPSASPGTQNLGPLFSAIRGGGVFVAPDYPAAGVGTARLQPFIHGVGQGVSMLDAARAVTGHAAAFGLSPIASDAEIPLVISGYSQGGGAALWAAQLARFYFDLQGDRTLDLAGVIAYEPAGTQLVASAREPRSLDGYHLADRAAYASFSGTAYLSWLARSWSQIRKASHGRLPFGPTPAFPLAAMLSEEGLATSLEVVQFCTPAQLNDIGLVVMKYRDPDQHRLLRPPFEGSKKADGWQSSFDTTCRRSKGVPANAKEVCAWLRYNTLGPNGVNPFPKLPTNNAGELSPIYLAHGRADETVWCVDDAGAVDIRNCVTAQYRDSLKKAYCDGRGHLHVDYLAGVSHGNVYWRNFTNRETGAFYVGSPYDKFVSGAIAGTLPKTCVITNVDP